MSEGDLIVRPTSTGSRVNQAENAILFESYWHRLKLRDTAMAIPAPCINWQRSESIIRAAYSISVRATNRYERSF